MTAIEEVQQRLAILEAQMAQMMAQKTAAPGPHDWRSTIGMFTGDEVMQRIMEEALRIREEDREAARNDPNYFIDGNGNDPA